MAIDEKFINANISKGVVDRVNRPRGAKKKRPRPWDSPSASPYGVSDKTAEERFADSKEVDQRQATGESAVRDEAAAISSANLDSVREAANNSHKSAKNPNEESKSALASENSKKKQSMTSFLTSDEDIVSNKGPVSEKTIDATTEAPKAPVEENSAALPDTRTDSVSAHLEKSSFVSEQSSGTKYDNKDLEQKNTPIVLEQSSATNLNNNSVSDRKFRNNDSEQSSGTKIKTQDKTNISEQEGLKSSETKFENKVLEQNSESGIVLEQGSGTKTAEANAKNSDQEIVLEQTFATKIRNNDLEQVLEQREVLEQNIEKVLEQNEKFYNNAGTKFWNNFDENQAVTVGAGTDYLKAFLTLKGLKKKLVHYIYDECIKAQTLQLRTTYEHLAHSTDGAKESVRTTVKRLRSDKYKYIDLMAESRGPGAFIRITLTRQNLDDYMSARLKAEGSSGTIVEQSSKTFASSKLVEINSSSNLTKKEVPEQKPHYFELEDINAENLYQHGVTDKQISDIRNQRLNFTAGSLQSFIDRFCEYASDEANISGVKNVRGLFVRLAQLESKGENPLAGIKAPEDDLIDQLLAKKEQAVNDRLEKLKKLFELSFSEWIEDKDQTELNEIARPTPVMKEGSEAQKQMLKDHFRTYVYRKPEL
jgi:hypothetical protein